MTYRPLDSDPLITSRSSNNNNTSSSSSSDDDNVDNVVKFLRNKSNNNKKKKKKKEPTCWEQFNKKLTWKYVCGILFDFIQIVISIADVATDILVAKQFYQEDETQFFALVCTTLSLTSVTNAVVFGNRMNWIEADKMLSWLLVIIFAPFGLLLPVINYFMSKFNILQPYGTLSSPVNWRRTMNNIKIQEAAETDKVAGSMKRAAMQLFLTTVAPQHATLGVLDQSVTERVYSFLLLGSQIFSETLPQVAVQLVAISIRGRATTIQVVSLSLSLFSVVSKAFLLVRSFDVKAFFSKLFFISHDLFSFAFLMSCILSANTPHDTKFFGVFESFKLPLLANFWLSMKVVVAGIGLLLVIGTYVVIVDEMVTHQRWADLLKITILGIFGIVVLAAPVLLVTEITKFSWFILNTHYTEPSAHEYPDCSILHQFLHGGTGEQIRIIIDWKKTLADFRTRALKWCRSYRPNQAKQKLIFTSGNVGNDPRYAYTKKSLLPKEFSSEEEMFHVCQVPAIGKNKIVRADDFFSRGRHAAAAARFIKVYPLLTIHPGHYRFDELDEEEKFYSKHLLKLLDGNTKLNFYNFYQDFFTFQPRKDWFTFLLGVLVVIFTFTSVLGIIFPFIWCSLYWNDLMLMQHICLYSTFLFCFISVFLAPSYFRYDQTCRFHREHFRSLYLHAPTVDVPFFLVNSYYSAPISLLQKIAVPNATVPEECFRFVTKFVTTAHVGLFGMNSKEREEVSNLNYTAEGEEEEDEEEESDNKYFSAHATATNYGTINR